MSEDRYRTVKRRCPDCDAWVTTTINWKDLGWMAEGGYREAYCWPVDHVVTQPMYLDRRTNETHITCSRAVRGD